MSFEKIEPDFQEGLSDIFGISRKSLSGKMDRAI